MSYVRKRITSRALSLFDALEENSETRTRLWAAAGGIVGTTVMWVVHLTYPEIFQTLMEDRGWAKFLVGAVLAPPFVVAFSIGSFIYPQADKQGDNDSGPMSGYFYRESADRKYKLLIGAGLIAGLNLLLMMITSASD